MHVLSEHSAAKVTHVVADVPDSMVNQHARSFKFQ